MSVLFQSLLWIGLPLIAVPILIHLINLRRQKRIRWAAMQFLLESQRRNRRWIFLKQLLLLLARMAAIALLVFLLAHLSVRNEWLSLLGRGTTHHLILLDDSYSMSDHWEETTALAEGKRAVEAIVDQANRQSDRQLVTLLTFSEAAKLGAGAQPKIHLERINDIFRSRLPTDLAGLEVSQLDVGPNQALDAVPRLLSDDDDQTLIVYLVSDFRARQFADATEIRQRLTDLENRVDQFHLVRCAEQTHPNVAITALAPVSGVRAAGIEMWMNVTVANYGDAPARGVIVQLEQDGDALSALALEDIPPRKELTHPFRVQFAGTGAHWLSAALGADAVAVDNRRWFASELPAARPVLIIDGSLDGLGGRQLSLALAPGGNTRTGWQPHVETTRFLVDPERLSQQAAVCLLDVPRLADDELAALEEYVRNGGGLAIFVGSDIDRSYYNERLVRNGEGLFPAPLRLPMQLLDRGGESTPDVEVTEHPLFKVLAGRRNGLLPLLLVDYYYAVVDEWSPPADGSTRVIARLRNQMPLVIEKSFGKGRVIAQLTKLSSGETPLGRWTNWSLIPAFPVLANEMLNYLAAGGNSDSLFHVGDELVIAAPEAEFEPDFRIDVPGDGTTRAEVPLDATSSAGRLVATLEDTSASGVYHAQLQSRTGGVERRDYAVNIVAQGEGDLEIVRREQLANQLAGPKIQIHDASDMVVDGEQLAGFQISEALLAALVALLLAEQALAYSASYHIRG
jgi:hypothetical protein